VIAMKLMLTALVFFSITFFTYGIFDSRSRKRLLRNRLRELDITDEGISLEEIEMAKSFVERVLKPLVLKIGRILSNYTPKGFLERAAQKLTRAGFPRTDPVTYLGVKAVLAAGFLGFSLLLGLAAKSEISEMMVLFLILTAIGFMAPDFWIQTVGNKRKSEISGKLPDLLDLLTVSVEAGLGFDQALMYSSDKMKGPISEEIKRMLQEMRLGTKRSEALRDLADRVCLPDLTSFCAALIQADQLGVSIADVLRVQSDGMRQKRRQRSEEMAMKAPLKLLFPLIFFIFPTIFIILLGPAVISVMENLHFG
jgi:tight adherence protein C